MLKGSPLFGCRSLQNSAGRRLLSSDYLRRKIIGNYELLCLNSDKLRRAILICLPTVNARELNPTLRSRVFSGGKRKLQTAHVTVNGHIPFAGNPF
jgi:hypothetical protein